MANWHPETSREITKRIIATGTLILDTPAHFGMGQQNGTELLILEYTIEKRPLIPGASLAGALRQYLLDREAGYLAPEKTSHMAVKLFGTALDDDDTGCQSRVIVDDALGQGELTIREGVKIDGETRTADDGALFSVQVWEAGTTFDLRFELILYEDDNITEYESAFVAMLSAFQIQDTDFGSGEIRLGARKHRGYGRCHVDRWHISVYNMHNDHNLAIWLQNKALPDASNTFFQQVNAFADVRQSVVLDASLRLCDSILIRASSDVAESSHLTSNGVPVVSGTSIAGALRARAFKILHTIQPDKTIAQECVDDLFGKHGADGNDEMQASRLIVDEYPITDYEFNLLQNRVKIDRFTGGAFETALFDEQPVFATDNTRVHIHLELRFPDDEETQTKLEAHIGLLLLLFKDLATEDLPLGGESSVGRGRLMGDTATIQIKTSQHVDTIDMKQNSIDPSLAGKLQEYVEALWKEVTP